MKHMLKLVVAAGIASQLVACSFNPIGESTFDCNRKENPSEYCRSFKALEKSTNGPLPESRFDVAFNMSDHDRATGIAPDPAGKSRSKADVHGNRLLPHQQLSATGAPIAGMPLRKAPVVQRVLIKRFVDENDNLQDDVVVYREVKGSRWSGFESSSLNEHAPGAYPHRAKDSFIADVGTEQPTQQSQNLAQPGGGTDGAVGSAMSPADFSSGDVNSPKP
jgi:conjugal transfer pilus assembly protein TraV